MNFENENNTTNYSEVCFGKITFDSLLFLNGEFNEFNIFTQIPKIPIFAADGAGLLILNNGLQPDYIIGDLDSFSIETAKSFGFPIEKLVKIPEQETNDFEKTLKFMAEKGFNRILILGIHGGLYEHSLNNWSVLSRYSKLMNLTIYDKGRYGICVNKSFLLKTSIGEIISLVPKNNAVLTTHNLYWQLNNESLELGIREVTHNIATAEKILIEIHSGEIFLFIDQRLPYAPEFLNY
jgi:thiamine pyrophosphokinase